MAWYGTVRHLVAGIDEFKSNDGMSTAFFTSGYVYGVGAIWVSKQSSNAK